MRITLITILSTVAIGFAPAHALCYGDQLCTRDYWNQIDSLDGCEANLSHCLEVRDCIARVPSLYTATEKFSREAMAFRYQDCFIRNIR